MIKITIPLPPSVNALYQNQAFFNPKTKKYEHTGKRILSKEGRLIKSKIRAEAIIASRDNNWDKDKYDDTFLYMDAKVFFNRKGRDSDNLYKAIQDSLEGVIYNNDSQVLSRTQRVYFDKNNPRVELTLKPVEFVGIFDNMKQFEEFEEGCKTCSKYRKGSCSILKDSKNGTIRDEINEPYNSPNCTAFTKKKG